MILDIGSNLMGTIVLTMSLALFIVLTTRIGTTRHQATRDAWRAWQQVSMDALAKGQPVPPPPSELHGKR